MKCTCMLESAANRTAITAMRAFISRSQSLERHRQQYNSTVSSLMTRLGVKDDDILIIEVTCVRVKFSSPPFSLSLLFSLSHTLTHIWCLNVRGDHPLIHLYHSRCLSPRASDAVNFIIFSFSVLCPFLGCLPIISSSASYSLYCRQPRVCKT